MQNKINQELCTQCKLCMEVCPCNVIGVNPNNEIYFIAERESICQECCQCMAVCKSQAITVNGFEYGKDVFDLPENKVDYNAFVDFLSNRRSVRNFKNKPVSDELISQVLESISYAPHGAGPKEIEITVVNDRERIESALPHIEKFLDNVVKWIENPIVSFMIKRKKGAATFNTIKEHLYPISKLKNYKLEYGDRITRGAPAIIIFHAKSDAPEHSNNSLIYATYTMLAAHSLGLGTTMIGIVPNAINKVEEVRKIFQIPAGNEAVMSLIIGYPKIKYKRAVKRRTAKIDWIK